MYLQYRLVKDKYKLIQDNNRPDEDNQSILRGDYLDKSEENFVMPSRDEMMKYIFSDWQIGDILVVANSPLKYPKLQGDTLVEMTRVEVCASGDLSILVDGEYFENGKIIKVEYDESLGYLKKAWDRDAHMWIEGATPEEQLESQYKEYYSLNNPLRVDDMKEQGLYEEWRGMMLEMEQTLYGMPQSASPRMALFVQTEMDEVDGRALFSIPKASPQLEAYKNRFKRGVM